MKNVSPKRIFTWHVHGNYLYYLTKLPHHFYLPVSQKPAGGYGGKTKQFPWGPNVHEVPVDKVRELDLDVIIFQSREQYEQDQYTLFSSIQRALPKLYIEHNPPRGHPTDTLHPVQDAVTTIVHVTHFNQLMWNNGQQPNVVIEHGVKLLQPVSYTGRLDKGIVVINNLLERDRRLGLDIYKRIQQEIPLDLIGMGSEKLGGLGEIPASKLPQFISQYRFIFSPIRYTSLGLSLIEAMMIGLPLVGLATTELVTVVVNNQTGFLATNPDALIAPMKKLLVDKDFAFTLSKRLRSMIKKRFSIDRFCQDWNRLIQTVCAVSHAQSGSISAYFSIA